MITGSKSPPLLPLYFIIGAFLFAHVCFWALPNVFEIWNHQSIDRLFVMRANQPNLRPPYIGKVVHIDFNDTSVKKLQSHYQHRSQLAKVVENLTSMQVAAQVYDFIFAAPLDEQGDEALIQATRAAGSVYYGLAFELLMKRSVTRANEGPEEVGNYLNQTAWQIQVRGNPGQLYQGVNPLVTFLELARASSGLGSLSVKLDRDGVLRRVPLLVRYNDKFYPILPLQVICDYLSVSPQNIVLRPGKHLILGGAVRPGESAPYDIVIPIDHQGNMIVNFLGPWGTMDHYNLADIYRASDDRLELELWQEELRGKIVIIADVSTGSTDIGPVPTDANYPLTGVHANIIHNILFSSFLREFSFQEMLLVEAVLMAVLMILSLRASSIFFSVGSLSLAAVYVIGVALAFFYGHVILNLIRPLIMILTASGSILVYRYMREEKEKMEHLRQRDFIRDTFGRYLSNEVVEEILGTPQGLKMSGETREVTFLVSDLRGFTALTARLSPHEVIEIINRYFEAMVEILARYRGTVNEFQGDGILAFFGAPLFAADDCQRAVACAVEMQLALKTVNAEQRRLGLPELAMGIGINTGEVVVGNIGSEKRVAYGAVGSAINEAYRIESFTVGGQILISPSTYAKTRDLVEVDGVKEVQFKGLQQPVSLYAVTGIGGDYAVHLPAEEPEKLTKLKKPLSIDCFLLEGKSVSDVKLRAQITHVSQRAADVILDKPVRQDSNYRVLFFIPERTTPAEAYAKVIAVKNPDTSIAQKQVRLRFTWMSEEVKKFLEHL